MAAESSPYKHNIAEIFESNEPPANSKLVYLSNLDGEELEFLKQAWSKADVKRRHQVISQLVHLSEADLKLNFSTTFVSCLDDTDETVRTQAIVGLEAEEDHILVPPLIRTLKK